MKKIFALACCILLTIGGEECFAKKNKKKKGGRKRSDSEVNASRLQRQEDKIASLKKRLSSLSDSTSDRSRKALLEKAISGAEKVRDRYKEREKDPKNKDKKKK